MINFQQISECKLTQLYSLPDTGKKADKKRYLFTRPRRKWTCSDENMLHPLLPLECKPSRIKRLHKNASKNLCNPASIILNSGGLLLNILPGLVHINLPESTGFLFDHDSKLATNIVYHINDTDNHQYRPICTEICITEDHLDTQFHTRTRHCKHQVLLHVNLATETLYSVPRRYRYPEIYIYQTSNSGGGA